jgi:hypothetical protein
MEITKKEFDERYGNVEVEFASYYKYSFGFRGKTDTGLDVYLSVGGCADDIYRMEVVAGEKIKVKELEARFASVAESGAPHSESIHTYSEFY